MDRRLAYIERCMSDHSPADSEFHPAFSQVLGQTVAINFLSRSLASGRLPHGLVFAGPQGVGRRTTAEALAAIFLADDATDVESVRKAAHNITSRTHPDFYFITREMVRDLDGKSQNKAIDLSVNVIRQFVIEQAGRKPVLGRGKVFLIRDAQTMNTQSQNALLKTLEEPPGRTLIILLTDKPGALLSTIRSRSQMVRFVPLTQDDAQNAVTNAVALATEKQLAEQARVAAESLKPVRGRSRAAAVPVAASALPAPTVEPALIRRAVELSKGSPGLALRWIEEGVVLRVPQLFELLETGGDLASFLKESSDAFAKKRLESDPLSSEDNSRRVGIMTYLRLAADRYRADMRMSDDADQTQRLCGKIDRVRRAEVLLEGNANVALVLQMVSMQ